MRRLAEGEAAAVGAGLVALQRFHIVVVLMAAKEPGKGPVKTMAAVVMWEPLSEWSESVWLSLGARPPRWQRHKGHTAAALPPSSPAVETAATAVPGTQAAAPGGLAGCCSGQKVGGGAAAVVAVQVSGDVKACC